MVEARVLTWSAGALMVGFEGISDVWVFITSMGKGSIGLALVGSFRDLPQSFVHPYQGIK